MAQFITEIISTSGTDTYTGSLKTKYPEYQKGLYLVTIGATNTGASTLNIDGLGAVGIVNVTGTALAAGNLLSGRTFCMMYDGTNFIAMGVVSTADTNFANSDLTLTGDRVHNLGGYILEYQDTGGSSLSIDLVTDGNGFDLTHLITGGGASFSFDGYGINTNGGAATGNWVFNLGPASGQFTISPTGGDPAGFTLSDNALQTTGYVSFDSKETTYDAILSGDQMYYLYATNSSGAGILHGRYRATGGGLGDVLWDYTKVQPGTNGQFLRTTSGASIWANIQYSDITGAPTVSGTANYISKFTGTSVVGNSRLVDDGTYIYVDGFHFSDALFSIQTTNQTYALGVNNTNTSGTTVGLYAASIGASTIGVGAFFQAANATTKYSVRLVDGSESVGRFLKNVATGGYANWASISYSDISSMTSAQLASIISDETGSASGGLLVFNNSPAITSPTITGGTALGLTGLGVRTTGTGAFDVKFATADNLTADRTVTFATGNASRLISLSGDLGITGDFSTVGGYSVQLTATGATALTLPTTGTLATLAGTETFTNKTLTSPTINGGTATGLTQLSVLNSGTGAYSLSIVANETLTSNKNLTFIVNDVSRVVTFGGDFTISGGYSVTLVATGSTSVTLPTTGTLATLAGSETLTNKTIGNTNTITVKDNLFTIQDGADTSKQVVFIADGLTTGTTTSFAFNSTATRTINIPSGSASITLVSLDDTQALTNKTYNGLTVTTTTGTFTLTNGKTLSVSNTLTFTGTDGSSVAFGAGGTVLYNGGALGTPSSGTLTNCTGLPIAGLTASTSTAIGVGSIELGHASDTTLARVSAGVVSIEGVNIVTVSSTDTLTNKRITPRVTSITSSATPTVNTDSTDFVDITALAAAITSMTTNLSGTPTNGQKLTFRIKDNGTARAITWGASFEACGVALPTTTTISKRLTVGFLYDTTTSKWGCVASLTEA